MNGQATKLRTLPTTGRFIVDTTIDTWDVDVDARVAIWHDMAHEAAGFHTEPEPFLFDTVECAVGEAMLFDADRSPRPSPIVVGITAVEVIA